MKDRNTIDQTPLLSLEQAARMLSVSEVSLRRWTNAGRLACVRVGPKRERRFRHSDLMAFLETQDGKMTGVATEAVVPKRQAKRSRSTAEHGVLVDGAVIAPGEHLGLVYSNDLGRLRWSVPFLADGLKSEDACLLVASPGAQQAILSGLKERSPEVDSLISSGKLGVVSGEPTADAMFEAAERFLRSAVDAGSSRIRIVGDMAWCFGMGLPETELANFELRYDMFLAHRYPVISLCQYDARLFSGIAILGALKCHRDIYRRDLAHFLG